MIPKEINLKKIVMLIIIVLICGIILYILPDFINTEYYSDKEMAYSAVQGLSYEDGLKASAKYINKFYWVYNTLCHIWGLFIAGIFIVVTKNLLDFLKDRESYNICKKICIYLWINLSYVVWANLSMLSFMKDIQKEVLDSCHDSIGIPLIGAWVCIMFLAMLYYPIINIITFFAYNITLNNKFFNIVFIIISLFMILIFSLNIYSSIMLSFIPESIIVNIINIVWLMLGFKYLKKYIYLYKHS